MNYKDIFSDWKINLFHYTGTTPLPNPIQTPEESVENPQHGPMSDDNIQNEMDQFFDHLTNIGDDCNE
jgi:hypothetical protein